MTLAGSCQAKKFLGRFPLWSHRLSRVEHLNLRLYHESFNGLRFLNLWISADFSVPRKDV